MEIEVVVIGWEQECCGEPFRVGGNVTWNVSADDPAPMVDGTLPRYVEGHHGDGEPGGVIGRSIITGTVHDITGRGYPTIPVAGRRWTTSDLSDPRDVLLEYVDVHDETYLDTIQPYGVAEFRVRVEVADGTRLPTFTCPAEGENDEHSPTWHATRVRQLREDGFGIELTEFTSRAAARYQGAVDVLIGREEPAATFIPHASGACTVRWARDGDGIALGIGDGDWTLPATPASLAQLQGMLDAAAAGRVEETCTETPDKGFTISTIVTSDEGATWSTSQEIPVFRSEGGEFAAYIGSYSDRTLTSMRKPHGYVPWE